MISFNNDYSEGAHPLVFELLMKTNFEQNEGYGLDAHSDKAKEYIKKEIKRQDVDIHFIPGGTQTNLIVISAFLRQYQCVIAANTGHINVHETGAIEATGHKVLAMPHVDGKLTTGAIVDALNHHTNEHMVQPKMVYISDTTELGTVYTKAELTAISDLCKEKGLILFLDGARLATALTSRANDLEIEEIAKLVDVFYIGGTKNGALLGEALIICREDLKEDFRYMIKQRGAMLAKGFVIGMQFEALFQPTAENQNGKVLYYELGQHANDMAEQIAASMKESGYDFYAPICSNQLFPILPDQELEALAENFRYQIQDKVDKTHTAIRFVTSWATRQEHVDALKQYFRR